jgi:hypothetical protein
MAAAAAAAAAEAAAAAAPDAIQDTSRHETASSWACLMREAIQRHSATRKGTRRHSDWVI